jgi:hypothetical protein
VNVQFSSARPSFFEFKFVKALFDYERAHAVMLRTSPDHEGFHHGQGDLEELRLIVDDLLTDVSAAWDGFLEEVFTQFGFPPGKLPKRLAALGAAQPAAKAAIDTAWNELFKLLNEGRNVYQHEGYWGNRFGIGQGDGPFQMDMIEPTKYGSTYMLRDVRRALHRLFSLNADLKLGVPLPQPSDPCAGCGGDDVLGGKSTTKFADRVQTSDSLTISLRCGVCDTRVVADAAGQGHCPRGHY